MNFGSMIHFLAFFFAVVLLANPIPQNSDDLVVEGSYDVASSNLASSDNPECTTSIPSTDLADDNVDDSGDDGNIFRRGALACPNTFLPTTEKKTPNAPYNPYIPATQRAPPPSDGETKKQGNPPDPCPNQEYSKHVSCGGAEVRHRTTREILFVTNCVPGKVLLVSFHLRHKTTNHKKLRFCGCSLGVAIEIEAHGPWEKKTKIAQYCCQQYLPAVRSIPKKELKKGPW